MSKVRMIGQYRIYRGRGDWVVLNTKTNAVITRHADSDLAVAAAERYHAADVRRTVAQNLTRHSYWSVS